MDTTPTSYFRQYIKRVGGRRMAAERLGVGVAQVGHIVCGRRGISAKVAQSIDADTQGEICKAWLRPDLWDESECNTKRDS
jgi:DNA-binding transcriptional regulator YdaS (Cro superfamily)